jgi:hypothetical protein
MDAPGGVDESAKLRKRLERHGRHAKGVRRQRLGQRTEQEDLKGIQRLWELRKHALVNRAMRMLFPRLHGGRLQCSNCIAPLPFAHVQVHSCDPRKSRLKVQLTKDLVAKGGRCVLCQRFAVAGRDHACNSLSRVCIDLTAMSAFWDGGEMAGRWERDPLAVTRRLMGPWVIVFPGNNENAVMRHHAFVWESQVPGAGAGIFTLSGLRSGSRRQVEAFDAPLAISGSSGDWKPVETRLAVGYYTGEAMAEGVESDRLSALTLEDGSMIDPERFGGVLVRANQAHGTAANACVIGSALMVAARFAKPGRELFWDYRSYTDDPDDPLLGVECKCGGRACRYAHIEGVEGRKCPGVLLELVAKAKA